MPAPATMLFGTIRLAVVDGVSHPANLFAAVEQLLGKRTNGLIAQTASRPWLGRISMLFVRFVDQLGWFRLINFLRRFRSLRNV